MKIKSKLLRILVFLLFIIPINVFAYSSYIIPGGETIGIQVNSKGVLVVGFYKVNNSYIGRSAGFSIGDKIIKINNKEINNISSMIEIINNTNSDTVDVVILRNNEEKKMKLELKKDNDGVLKTGLYVKDSITGIGTLSYIDPNTKIFGALGHEIYEKTTTEKFDIKDGIIFGADVVSITKSENGSAGEKSAKYNKTEVFGTVKENEISGIFGLYNSNINNSKKIEVGESKDIKTGKAYIKTVIENNTVEDFEINILKIDEASDTKNILFEVTDQKLLNKTGGIIQGMSGSPIIQNGKLVGAVTHVFVNDPTKGYGIFAENMLEKAR